LLEERIDFDTIHRCDCLKLFIAATNVRTGAPKIFENEQVTIEALLASACLPQLFQAVEIDGEAYWDGGYVGNPSLWPLFYHAQCRDILLVHVNPINRDQTPKTMPEIENRLNEITFNAALLKELRSIDFVKKLVHDDMLKDEYKDQYKDILLHSIRTDDVMSDLDVDSKADTDWSFLTGLRDLGRVEAQKWLSAHFADIGKKATVEIQKDYLDQK
jgi:NTE family protein